jgi:DNA-binding Lrp family transcriptional regulator
MARRKKPPKTGLVSSDTAPSATETQICTALSALRDSAAPFIDACDWKALAALARTPSARVDATDLEQAIPWLARALVLALTRGTVGEVRDLEEGEREELRAALSVLERREPLFHQGPEFDLYLRMLPHTFEATVRAFMRLARARAETPRFDWVCRLRGLALQLMEADEFFPDLSPDEMKLRAALPQVDAVLADAYGAVETACDLSEENRLFLKVLRIELETKMAEPWDYDRVVDAIRRLPSPSLDDLRASDARQGDRQLTPTAWAFLWELSISGPDNLEGMLAKYPNTFHCEPCDALVPLVRTLSAAGSSIDQDLTEGVHRLMRFSSGWTEWVGDSITLQASTGPTDIPFSFANLRVPQVSDLLLRLVEMAPGSYPRHDELSCLWRIYDASTRYEPLQDEENADEYMTGLDWVCARSVQFQFAAAAAVQGSAGRAKLFLDALRRCVVEDETPPHAYFDGSFEDDALTEAQAIEVQDGISALVPQRDQMVPDVERLWKGAAGSLFSALSKVDGEVRHRTLNLAREFSEDLLAAGESFRLAYLEQVAGDPSNALDYYLINFDTSKELVEAAVKNAQLLWRNSTTLSVVSDLVEILRAGSGTNKRVDVVRQLLADAQARANVLNQQDQFERTAVNRWPSLTAPARKLLGVLAAIQRYNGFRELGEYAGMSEEWVERHYDKLVDLGMVLRSGSSYRINPHIEPLLARESQHAVVGRIVRAQGTSAVKQVFNSQREFTIYQVLVQLCPNHLVFPNSSLQSIMSFERMKELVSDDDFGYYLRASVDIVVVSSTTYLPMLAIEVDSVWHDTERQQRNDDKKDRLFAAAGIPFMRLRPVGSPTEETVRGQVAEHLDDLVRTLRVDLPGYEQARGLLQDLSGSQTS